VQLPGEEEGSGLRQPPSSEAEAGPNVRFGDEAKAEGPTGVASDRLALIREAIRKGEERAARRAGENVEEASLAELGQHVVEVAAVEPDAAEVRIRKTLEFCPDGVLAGEILRELSDGGLQPGAGAYDAVLEAFSRRGALDDALALFQDMQDARVAPTDTTYDALARPAARGGDHRFVEMLYAAKAQDRGGNIGAASLALLLDAYANGLPRQAGRAEAAFRGAMASANQEDGTAPEDVMCGRVLAALRRAVGCQAFVGLCKEYGLDPEATNCL